MSHGSSSSETDVAVVFELVIECGADEEAVAVCRWLTRAEASLVAGAETLRLHPPRVDRVVAHGVQTHQVSLIPAATGYMVALDKNEPRRQLSSAELTELGHHLYGLLKGAPRYLCALLGWEVDWVTFLELETNWRKEISEGSFDGLVIANELRDRLPRAAPFEAFDERRVWIPYEGSHALDAGRPVQ